MFPKKSIWCSVKQICRGISQYCGSATALRKTVPGHFVFDEAVVTLRRRALITAWLDASRRSRGGSRLNKSARE